MVVLKLKATHHGATEPVHFQAFTVDVGGWLLMPYLEGHN